MTAQTLTVTPLVGRDARLLAGLLKSEVEFLKDLQAQFSGQPNSAQAVGTAMLSHLLDAHLESAWAFLAEKAGMTPEELDAAPISTSAAIVDKLVGDPDILLFFDLCKSSLDRGKALMAKGD